MEHLGPDVNAISISNHKTYSIGQVVGLGLQLVDALESFHSLGFVHNDLKPPNIMVGAKRRGSVLMPVQRKEFKCYLIDYGLATPYIDNKL